MATSDVEGLLGRKGVFLAINNHPTVACTAVHYTQLTVVHKVFLLDVLIDIQTQFPEVFQLQRGVDGHRSTKDETVVV